VVAAAAIPAAAVPAAAVPPPTPPTALLAYPLRSVSISPVPSSRPSLANAVTYSEKTPSGDASCPLSHRLTTVSFCPFRSNSFTYCCCSDAVRGSCRDTLDDDVAREKNDLEWVGGLWREDRDLAMRMECRRCAADGVPELVLVHFSVAVRTATKPRRRSSRRTMWKPCGVDENQPITRTVDTLRTHDASRRYSMCRRMGLCLNQILWVRFSGQSISYWSVPPLTDPKPRGTLHVVFVFVFSIAYVVLCTLVARPRPHAREGPSRTDNGSLHRA